MQREFLGSASSVAEEQIALGRGKRGPRLVAQVVHPDEVQGTDRWDIERVLQRGPHIYDPVKLVIGAAHAGWRGTVKKMAANTILKMQEQYGCSPKNICVGIGPSIGPCCYNVGGEVIQEVLQTFGTTEGLINFNNPEFAPILDLWSANKMQLIEVGVSEENIEIAEICTNCHHDDFFSSRHGKGITGRFGAGIMIK